MKATHFIEVVKGNFGCFNSPLSPLIFLQPYLEATTESGMTTIAIWKIKFK